MENLFTEKYDAYFREIGVEEDNPIEKGIYNYLPQMLPWVGDEYGKGNSKRILLVGESHYLPDIAEEEYRTAGGWYYQDTDALDEESVSWTNTREATGLGPMKWTNHRLYRETNKIIGCLKDMDYKNENLFKYVSFYNYFLRPAYPKGKSIQKICEEIDFNVAYDTFCGIVKTIEPDFIYFLSKFAWDSLMLKNPNYKGIKMDYSPHLACPWSNRKNYHLENHNELLTGKEKFFWFLKNNKIF
jgi:hypothetical protein